jgi:hypothetical protein
MMPKKNDEKKKILHSEMQGRDQVEKRRGT